MPITTDIATTAARQIEKIEEILIAQQRANKESSRRRAEFAVAMNEVFKSFENKPAGSSVSKKCFPCGGSGKIEGGKCRACEGSGSVHFKTFENLIDYLSGVFELHRRQMWKYVLTSRELDGRIAPDQMADLGIEKLCILARLERFRPGSVKRPGFLEQVSDMSVSEIDCKVDGLIGGRDELLQTGKWERIVLWGPREYVSLIKDGIALGRRQLGAAPSDAEVLWQLAVNSVQELQGEEEHARQQIAGVEK